MNQSLRLNTTMNKELLERLDAYAHDHHEDRSTAVRQLVDYALRDIHKKNAIEAYTAGRATLREFAHSLGLNTWAAHDLLRSEGIAVATGTRSETSSALDELVDQAR